MHTALVPNISLILYLALNLKSKQNPIAGIYQQSNQDIKSLNIMFTV